MSAQPLPKEPEQIEVKGIDIVPNTYGIWCAIEGHPEPFVNPIVGRRWSEDGAFIWVMLDSHNFDKFAPDEMVRVVKLGPSDYRKPPTHTTKVAPFEPHCGCTSCFAAARPKPQSREERMILDRLTKLPKYARERVLKQAKDTP